MSSRAMVFIDGSWLYAGVAGKKAHIDFDKLNGVLANKIAQHIGGNSHIDVVRSYLFGSYAQNYNQLDSKSVQNRLDFFAMLHDRFGYEVCTYPVDFHGRRLRKVDREPDDKFDPQNKSSLMAMAGVMSSLAALSKYDIAIVLTGDGDLRPVLQQIRQIGCRVQLASFKGISNYQDTDRDRVSDYPIIWLDDCLEELTLVYQEHQLECQSANHVGPRMVTTTFHPNAGQRFFCDTCRNEFKRANGLEDEPISEIPVDESRVEYGFIKKIVAERGFGFIECAELGDFFFHMQDLTNMPFDQLAHEMRVSFVIKKPAGIKAGAAVSVTVMPEIEDEDDNFGNKLDDDVFNT